MTLTAATRLGPYEIVAPLGAGGMGEVYRARDTRLGRDVAVKVLPTHRSANEEFRQRFEQEARMVSQLSHPHICVLYDVGREGETAYLVMELLEGETLSERLAKGPLPPDQTLRYGIEMADAMALAHRQGIVHRDLKPGNVMLTRSGVKLVDFGLARLTESPNPGSDDSALATQAAEKLTAEGTVLGTVQYMAPEQLEGKKADARTDIFALGSVLYEMATGRRAFSGTSRASLISAIMASEPPPLSTLQPMSPRALDRVVKTCLAKDPDDRWQSARDLGLELRWISGGGSIAELPVAVAGRRNRLDRLGWVVAALAVLVALALTTPFLRAPAHEDVIRFFVYPPEKSSLMPVGAPVGAPTPLAVSPDGRQLAFVASTSGDRPLLWVRPLDSLTAHALPGTEGASFPFWSPDSRFLGFFAQGKLRKIEVSGGPPQTLADAPDTRGGTWSRDGVILFAPGLGEPLHRVSAAGGPVTPVTSLDPSSRQRSHRWPQFLPDGQHFLFLAISGQQENRGIYVGSLSSKEEKRLLGVDSNTAYAPPGSLLYVRGGTLLAQPFDAKRLELTGDPLPVAAQVRFASGFRYAAFSVSETGRLAYWSGTTPNGQLIWFDRGGKQLGSIGARGNYGHSSLSHDDKRIAVHAADPQTGLLDIWLLETQRGTTSRFTFGPTNNSQPVWSPDDSQIVFSSDRGGLPDLFLRASNGAGEDEVLLEASSVQFPTDWSFDGRFIVLRRHGPKTGADLWVLPLFGDRKPIPYLQTAFNETRGLLSPNGRWMAYVSDESGTPEVYVQPFPKGGGKWKISTNGGADPKWRRDGKELFFIGSDRKLMTVSVRGEPTFEAGVPRALFDTGVSAVTAPLNSHYSATSDGQRFLVNSVPEEAASSPVTIVLNWTAGLKK